MPRQPRFLPATRIRPCSPVSAPASMVRASHCGPGRECHPDPARLRKRTPPATIRSARPEHHDQRIGGGASGRFCCGRVPWPARRPPLRGACRLGGTAMQPSMPGRGRPGFGQPALPGRRAIGAGGFGNPGGEDREAMPGAAARAGAASLPVAEGGGDHGEGEREAPGGDSPPARAGHPGGRGDSEAGDGGGLEADGAENAQLDVLRARPFCSSRRRTTSSVPPKRHSLRFGRARRTSRVGADVARIC